MSNYIYKGVDKIKYEEMISSEDLLYSLYEIGMHQVSGYISLNEIYIILYKMYGNTIIFSKRSLKVSKKLYLKYSYLERSEWDFCSYIVLYQLLKKNKAVNYDLLFLNFIKQNSLNSKESLHYLRYGNIKHFQEEDDFLLLEFKKILIK